MSQPEHESGVAQEWATERQHTVKDGIRAKPPPPLHPAHNLRGTNTNTHCNLLLQNVCHLPFNLARS
eukprot:1178910-Rhodomonas_salina.2